jgi:phosphatidylserine/phosphatidylglycerophosphate/cardiolipin synthase-like enzyme
MVIDNTTILTGSFNFTKAAEAKNAENLLVIQEAPELVKAYEQNIHMHAAHSHPHTRAVSTGPSAASSASDADSEVRGNRHSKVYRVSGCKGYASMKPASVVAFATEAEAQQAGVSQGKKLPVRRQCRVRDRPLCGNPRVVPGLFRPT